MTKVKVDTGKHLVQDLEELQIIFVKSEAMEIKMTAPVINDVPNVQVCMIYFVMPSQHKFDDSQFLMMIMLNSR